jgi:hypothetical protein
MKRPPRRFVSLGLFQLEERRLLSGPGLSGTWLGQDGHDLVGSSSVPGPDGVQDMHIAISGLPANRTVVFADVQGLGGGDWEYNGPFGPWAAALVRTAGSTSADLYLEPYQVETGRPFSVQFRYDDGTTDGFWVTGGTADPNLRMPDAALQVQWIGQDGHDLAGPGPAVGPDGIQDVHLALAHLSAGVGVSSVDVIGPNAEAWSYGTNLEGNANAELVPNASDPSQVDLYFDPLGNLAGQTLSVTIDYANGKTDSAQVVAGSTDPNLRMPAPPPVQATWEAVTAQWLGQDGLNLVAPGDVHVRLGGLPSGRTIVAASLSDVVGASWVYQPQAVSGFYADPYALPLGLKTVAGKTGQVDLSFPPARDETGTALTLRLQFSDGSTGLATFAGGFEDPGLRSPFPAATAVVAHPGDDLNALANHFGSVHLSAGTYNLSQPLVLNNPVTITADPGATLLFSQPSGSAPWTAAIKINRGHTSLLGFAVRFATPVNWNQNTNYGPAVIGTTDNFDPAVNDPRAGLLIANMNLQSPPASSAWEEAPRLIRVATATSGTIAGNILKGGTTEFLGGPWRIVNNVYQGTVPDTYSSAAFAGHNTHDLVLEGNTASPVGPSGKTWRFLVLTSSGASDLIANNTVTGIGPMDNDTVPSANATEIILTEDYQIHFEGAPAGLSADGRILQIPSPQGGAGRAGDVVAILAGPDAGQWVRITQVINPTTYVLERPLSPADSAISVTTGFVNETFQGNTVDARGSTTALDMYLAGNHFGTTITGNHLLGGAVGLLVSAAPTEQPVVWGWTHAPFLGATITDNTIEDAQQAINLMVEHSTAIKLNEGRVYLSATLSQNTVFWSDAFVTQRAQAGISATPLALTVGNAGAIDPGELVLVMQGNQQRGPAGFNPAGTMLVTAATINGNAEVDQETVLPTAPPAAPTGLSLADPIAPYQTSDGKLQFGAVLGAAGYEYRIGNNSTYTSIGNKISFVPAGLAPGFDVVYVRAFDDSGQRGPDARITFVVPTAHPFGVWAGQDGHDFVGPWPVAVPDGIQDIHIVLVNLPANRQISFIDIEGFGGGQWQYNGPWGPWQVHLVRALGSNTASIYFQPSQVETGRPFWILLRYADGSTDGFWVIGGQANPHLHMPAVPGSGAPQTQTPAPAKVAIAPPPTKTASVATPTVAAPSVAQPLVEDISAAPPNLFSFWNAAGQKRDQELAESANPHYHWARLVLARRVRPAQQAHTTSAHQKLKRS